MDIGTATQRAKHLDPSSAPAIRQCVLRCHRRNQRHRRRRRRRRRWLARSRRNCPPARCAPRAVQTAIVKLSLRPCHRRPVHISVEVPLVTPTIALGLGRTYQTLPIWELMAVRSSNGRSNRRSNSNHRRCSLPCAAAQVSMKPRRSWRSIVPPSSRKPCFWRRARASTPRVVVALWGAPQLRVTRCLVPLAQPAASHRAAASPCALGAPRRSSRRARAVPRARAAA